LTFKNKFFIIALENHISNGGFAMNSLDENYDYVALFPAVLNIPLISKSIPSKPPKQVKTFNKLNNKTEVKP
jgi:hypothetical protein